MEAGSRGPARTKLLRPASLAITIATVLALASVPAFAQDPADGSVPPPPDGTLPPPPPEALADCATGGDGSTQGYVGTSPAEAADLLTHGFPCLFDSLAADPPQDSGIDLSLQSDGDSYQPANPLAPLTLPGDLGGEVTFGDRGVAVDIGATDPEAAAAASAEPLAGEGLFYAAAAQASDVLLAPVTTGVEVVYQLRAPESPEHLEIDLDLPDGASLRATDDGGAQMLQRNEETGMDEAVGTVSAPQAIDANGDPIAATMTVNGNSLELDVPHSDPEITYPIALTSAVQANPQLGYNIVQQGDDLNSNFATAKNSGLAKWFRGGPGMPLDRNNQEAYVFRANGAVLNTLYVIPGPGEYGLDPAGSDPVSQTTTAEYYTYCYNTAINKGTWMRSKL